MEATAKSNWKTTQNAPDAGAFSPPSGSNHMAWDNSQARVLTGRGAALRGHLAASGDISACHTWGRKMPPAPREWRTGTLLNIHDTQGSPTN